MIDPHNIPEYFTKDYLEEFILFAICVANKPAVVTSDKVAKFLASVNVNSSPFSKINYLIRIGNLERRLEEFKLGQYTRISKAFRAVLSLNLVSLSVASLEEIPGIGPKTSRYIMLYYKPDTKCVPLDTHVLRWLGTQGYPVPKGTPSGKHYLRLENAFINEALKQNLSIKDLDTQIWRKSARI